MINFTKLIHFGTSQVSERLDHYSGISALIDWALTLAHRTKNTTADSHEDLMRMVSKSLDKKVVFTQTQRLSICAIG